MLTKTRLTNLPVKLFTFFRLKVTKPAAVAKRLSLRPFITFLPGCTRVPFWRTIMLPARTFSPPNFFTPNRWAFESRPKAVLPPAFLCAILDLRLIWANKQDVTSIMEKNLLVK